MEHLAGELKGGHLRVRQTTRGNPPPATPNSLPPQLSPWIVAPRLPHRRQRKDALSLSLDAEPPHRMISGASATGAR
jgi:hypothetical protein